MSEPTIQQVFDLAVQHHEAGRLHQAEGLYRQILDAAPGHVPSLHNLGLIAHQVERHDIAAQLLRQAVALEPANARWHFDLGVVLGAADELDEAIAAYMHAIALQPDFPEACNNLGNALKEKGRLDEAIAAYRQAVHFGPGYADAHHNLGVALASNEQLDEAIAAYWRAIEIDPQNARLHCMLASLLLSMGRFAEGWEEFEWRLKDEAWGIQRDFGKPRWNGEDLAGKTLLLLLEGGYGDAFQFIRYVPMLAGRAGKLILEIVPPLEGLFAGVPGVELVLRGRELPAFDYHITLQSLPRLFKTELTNIPSAVPYLPVPEQYRSHWAGRVQRDGAVNVGVVWAGSPYPKNSDEFRTRELSLFAPLLQVPGARFYSLQKGPQSNDIRPAGLELIDLTAEINDFADTAALIEALDLVISVDTSVAHLAGALGKPVWVLIPQAADFRWLRGRADSPWYPTMRLFRQKSAGDWSDVIAEVRAALLAEARRAAAGTHGHRRGPSRSTRETSLNHSHASRR